ncbi:hypothetical protein [Pedobacter nototheniae]|uniref:hypothetical protein n=1 Tax=Pedobacter nototheniae TaxID=2488994 RepID=UPI00292CE40D|nr:hypothetical protein [Pedobacter nototheniae]
MWFLVSLVPALRCISIEKIGDAASIRFNSCSVFSPIKGKICCKNYVVSKPDLSECPDSSSGSNGSGTVVS